jgi:hypothetical protein
MRSILALISIAVLGFIFILQKKDAPETTIVKTKPAELRRMNQVSQNNRMKPSPDGAHAVAQNAVQTRKRK